MTEQHWVDEVAIERALRGQRVGRSLTDAERRYIVDFLVSQGKGSHAICRALRCNGSTARLLYEDATARLRAGEHAEGVPAA